MHMPEEYVQDRKSPVLTEGNSDLEKIQAKAREIGFVFPDNISELNVLLRFFQEVYLDKIVPANAKPEIQEFFSFFNHIIQEKKVRYKNNNNNNKREVAINDLFNFLKNNDEICKKIEKIIKQKKRPKKEDIYSNFSQEEQKIIKKYLAKNGKTLDEKAKTQGTRFNLQLALIIGEMQKWLDDNV